jgi:tetratricopeptide (TPR) repeat protein
VINKEVKPDQSQKETNIDDRYWSVDQAALGLVLSQAGKLKYKYRPIDRFDQGVDGELQIEQVDNANALGALIGVQIKGRSDCRINKDNTVSITVEEKNLLYWKRFGRPVILIVCLNPLSATSPQLYWSRVDNVSTRTIRVSLDQKFDESTRPIFLQMISEYYSFNMSHTPISLNVPLKNISEVLAGFVSTVGEVIEPVEKKLIEADTYMSQGNYKESAQLYEALSTIFDNVFLFWYNWTGCLIEQRRFNDTLGVAYKIFNKWPEKWEAHFLLGSCLGLVGKLEEARESLEKALKLMPTESIIWSNLGLTCYWQEDYEAAYVALLLASSYDKNNYIARFNLALCLTLMERYEEALYFYDESIKVNTILYDGYNNKGMLLKCLGRIWEALDTFDLAIEVVPSNPLAFRNSAFLLKDLGYNERAIQRYHMAEERGQGNMELYSSLGLLYCREGNWDAARFYFHKYYDHLKNNTNCDCVNKKHIFFDWGYEVMYIVEVDFSEDKVNVVSVECHPEYAVFNIPEMRFLLAYAHVLNIPFLIDDPHKAFKPDLNRDRNMLGLHRMNIDQN